MEVYLLSLYLCSTVADLDITEKICRWEKVQFYKEENDCKEAYEKAEENLKENTAIEKASCKLVKVL